MTTKKIISYAIILYLTFTLVYVGVKKCIDPNEKFSGDNSVMIEAIESEKVEISEDDKIKAKTTYYPFEDGDYLKANDSYGDYLNDYFIVVNREKEGLIDTDGRVIVDILYEGI